jgi:O-phosphoseryl-tRNA(Cys) synthetase
VVLKFSSLQIQMSKGKKVLNPIYVPLSQLEAFVNLDSDQLELKLMKSLHVQDEQPVLVLDERHPELK